MEALDWISYLMAAIKLGIVLAALWHINKIKNKRIIYFFRIGLFIILFYHFTSMLLFYLSNMEYVEFMQLLPYINALSVMASIGGVIFALGFLLLAKEYRKAFEEKIQPAGAINSEAAASPR